MKIKNIDGRSAAELQREVEKGGKFVFYPFTVSLIVVTFKRTSGVYLVSSTRQGAPRLFTFTLISLLFGWWGIPWGPRHTIESIRTNFQGGKNVTDEVMAVVAGYALFEETQRKKQIK